MSCKSCKAKETVKEEMERPAEERCLDTLILASRKAEAPCTCPDKRVTIWRYSDGSGTYEVMRFHDIPKPYRREAERLLVVPTSMDGYRILAFEEITPKDQRYDLTLTDGECAGDGHLNLDKEELVKTIRELLAVDPMAEFKVTRV